MGHINSCFRFPADITDFRAHLDGRISWFETVNPARGRKLRRSFHDIDWA